jgi:hypothetical protein
LIYEKNNIILFLLNIISVFGQPKESISKVVVADNGDGTCKNPILHAGYIGTSFKARESKWIGAKIGFLHLEMESLMKQEVLI